MNTPLPTFETGKTLREALRIERCAGKTLAFVPTMGNLHAGHQFLIEEAHRHADKVVASIFVNPMQFGPHEDFASYPRTLAEDQAKLAEAGCDYLFCPSVEEVYPPDRERQTTVLVPEISEGLCGHKRKGHFDGVATVVTKLFNFVQPDFACFGQKDYQQLMVIRKLTADLNFPIEIISVPTQRAEDGLALSSRNIYLTEEERRKAAGLYATLQSFGQRLAQSSNPNFYELTHLARARLAELGFYPEYVEIRCTNLMPARVDAQEWILLAAARLGRSRLIDNLLIQKSTE